MIRPESYFEKLQQESIRQRLLARNNGNVPFELTGAETIIQMFDEQVLRHPDNPAIVGNGASLTYQQLSTRSRDVCFELRDARDIATAPVAIFASQYHVFLASALGILRAGGFYLPLDTSFPELRNSQILKLSGSRILLTERRNLPLAERIAPPGVRIICADEIESGPGDVEDRGSPDSLASVIFTSGSTGVPKGALQTHRNLLQIVRRHSNSLCLGYLDRTSLLSSFSVTASVGTIFGSLLNGSTLYGYSVPEHGLGKLVDWIDRERITIFRSVPSLFRHLMEIVPPDRKFLSVAIVRLSGDSVYKTDWQLFASHFSEHAVLAHLYGCSEMSTVAAFYMNMSSQLADGVVPVGYPLEDVEIGIEADDGQVRYVPRASDDNCDAQAAVTGEILLKSRYLSPGYWQDGAATTRSFQSGDTAGDIRVYRTGDLGAIRGDQGLVHLGRADMQVKLTGYRVEIAEVEACLRSYPGVANAAAVTFAADNLERVLIGFVTSRDLTALDLPAMRSHAVSRLPPHMVPSEIVVIDALPHTPNGKIARAELTALAEATRRSKVKEAPRTRSEVAIAEIWRQIFSLEEVGVLDNFFELGGNSLLGMKLSATTSQCFDIDLPVHSVYECPTIADLANLVDELMASKTVAPIHDRSRDSANRATASFD